MTIRDQIVEQALTLTPEDRAYVADALEQSLSKGGFATPEIASTWAAEIERRIAAYDRGEIQAAGAETAIERIRQHVCARRNKSSVS